MSTATAERRDARREGYVPGHEIPERVRQSWAAEIATDQRDREIAVAKIDRTEEKRADAQAVLEHVYTFHESDGSTVSLAGVEACERSYTDLFEAMRVLTSTFAVVAHIAPDVRAAMHTLGDVGAAPATIATRTAHDRELKTIREAAFAACAQDS